MKPRPFADERAAPGDSTSYRRHRCEKADENLYISLSHLRLAAIRQFLPAGNSVSPFFAPLFDVVYHISSTSSWCDFRGLGQAHLAGGRTQGAEKATEAAEALAKRRQLCASTP